MTKEQRDYIERQLNIIATKETEAELARYAASLFKIGDDRTRQWLERAVEVRKEEIALALPMAVNGELDDIDQYEGIQ